MNQDHNPHDARRGRITGQMVGAILGSNPNMSREDAMRRMVRDWHGAADETAANVAMDYAFNNIPGALTEYHMETGHAASECIPEPRDEWASADATATVSIFGAVIVICPFNLRDAKRPVAFKSLDEMARQVDRAQFYMWAASASWVDLYQWTPAETKLDRIMPDAAWRRKNLPKLKAFWDEFCEERQQDNAVRHLEPKRRVIDTPEAQRIIGEWDQICEAIDNATARKAELLADMVRISGSRDAEFGGRKLTLTKRVGSIAYAKAIKELAPDADLEKWRGKASESWGVK